MELAGPSLAIRRRRNWGARQTMTERIKYNKLKYILTISDENILKKYGNKKSYILPYKLPMIVEPNHYGPNEYGGYILNGQKYLDDIVIDKVNYRDKSKITSPLIYDMVNGISKVPYRINNELYNFILQNNKLGLLINPYEKHKFQDIEEKTNYQSKVYSSHVSKVLLQETLLDIAGIYRNFAKIYFPVRLDQRGRLYCEPMYLNYQGSELAKSLLQFAIPTQINKTDNEAINYLKAYGANLFGGEISKKSLKLKINWVDNNIDDILHIENGVLLSKAKTPLLFLAFCLEYRKLQDTFSADDKLTFNSYLPIQVDATCNGFQHLSLLSNETKLFSQLNLVESKSDEPGDFYTYILDRFLQKINIKIENDDFKNSQEKESYIRVKNLEWDRSMVKQIIMTIPYNATVFRMSRYLASNLVELSTLNKKEKKKAEDTWYSTVEGGEPKVNHKDLIDIAKVLSNTVLEDHEKIEKLRSYLVNVATLFNSLNIPIVWTLPSGLEVHQSYLDSGTIKIQPFSHKKIKLNIKFVKKDSFDKSKQIIALMPNLIHSLDASSLALLYNKLRKIITNPLFFSIHDCFAVPASSIDTIKILLASVYNDLYTDNSYLKTFDDYILSTLKHCTGTIVDTETRIVSYKIKNKDITYKLHDINWVTGEREVPAKEVKRINSQFLLI